MLAIGVARPAAAAVAPSTITGTVTDATGAPLAGVGVLVGSGGCDLCGSATTAADGTYTISGLDSTYTDFEVLFVPPAGTGLALRDLYPVTLTAGQTTTINVALQQQAFITGTVTGPDRNPVGGVAVNASGTDAGGSATTAADGTYSVALNPTSATPGPVTVEFNQNGTSNLGTQWWNNKPSQATADPIAVQPGQTISGINAQLQANVGSITGTVTGPSGPIFSAQVKLFTPGGTTPIATATSLAAGGGFTFNQVAPGTYQVEFAADGYAAQWWNGAADQANATLVTVTAGQTTSGISASLQPAAPMVVTGTVTGPDGKPLGGIQVQATYKDSKGLLGGAGGTTTAADGTYTMDVNAELSPDQTIRVYFNGLLNEFTTVFWNNKSTFDTADPIPFVGGQTVTGIDAQLAANLGAISGTVTTTAGQPLSGVQVTARNGSTNNTFGPVVTASDGTYTIPNLPAGVQYYVIFTYGTQQVQYNGNGVAVTINETASGVNGQFPAVIQGGTLSGTVTSGDSRTPVAGATVVLHNYFGFNVTQATAGADGRWAIGPVPGGVYRVEFQPPAGSNLLPQWWNDQPDGAHSNGVGVTNQQTVSGVDANLAAGQTVSGTINDAAGPVGNAWVGLFATDASGNPTVEIAHTTTGPDGTYQFGALADGHYRVLVDAPPGSPDSGTWLTADVSGSSVVDLNATLAPRTRGTISGTVTDTDGNPIAGANVYAFNADGVVLTAATGADGSYTISGIDVGFATVWFLPPSGTVYQGSVWNVAVGQILRINIDQGTNATGIDATLTSSASISGTVTSASGPLAGATVSVFNIYGFGDGTATTDAAGHYLVAGLGGGPHWVMFSDTGYVTQWWNNEPDLARADTVNVPDLGNATANATLTPSG
jgi:protocatechuate 3,4-dioxygenase beta subunit